MLKGKHVILQQVVATLKFLAERVLAFRGNDQGNGSPNNGYFMGTLELLPQFDPFLVTHIEKYSNNGNSSVSNLASSPWDKTHS